MIKDKFLLEGYNSNLKTNENGVLLVQSDMYYLYLRPLQLNELKKVVDYTLEFYNEKEITDDDIRKINFKESHLQHDEITEMNAKLLNKIQENKVEKKTFIYLAQNSKTKNLKIGFSNNPNARLQQLNNASDVRIDLLYTFKDYRKVENKLHKKYAYLRLNGEWFDYDQKIINEFKYRDNE